MYWNIKIEEKNIEDEPGDNLLNSIIGVNWEDNGKLYIHTEKSSVYRVGK